MATSLRCGSAYIVLVITLVSWVSLATSFQISGTQLSMRKQTAFASPSLTRIRCSNPVKIANRASRLHARSPLAVRAQTSPPEGEQSGLASAADLPAKAAVWSAWVVYNYVIFFSNYPCGSSTGDLCGVGFPTIKEAIDLSINFWFVTPLVFPSIAPVVHPALEGLFNFVIAFGALFVGFLSDGRGQKYAMLPFMVGTAFLTNVFYLPYLGIRRPLEDAIAACGSKAGVEVPEEQIQVAESKALPLAMFAVFVLSVAWGALGRGSGDFGDIPTRWNTLVDMALHSDRLAHSFMVDSLVFWAFQGWLVPDDMKRRKWENKGAEAVARAIPFFGLVYYLLSRPPLPERR